jgi:hypothetical protein
MNGVLINATVAAVPRPQPHFFLASEVPATVCLARCEI